MIDHCSEKQETSSSRDEVRMIEYEQPETAVDHDKLVSFWRPS